jgi:hypothetical protein
MDYSGKKIRNTLLFVTFLYCAVGATKVTIDADGGANYTSLDAFLKFYNDSTSRIMPDTVQFTGNDIDTFLMSTYISNRAPAGGILIQGSKTNPDSFPVINHAGAEDYYNFLQGKVSFEKVSFAGSFMFRAVGTTNPVIFQKCVIKGYSTAGFISIENSSSAQSSFVNCLFVNNSYSGGLINLDFYGGVKKISFINCTFDNNKKVFSLKSGTSDSTVTFLNSVFSGNDTLFTSAKMKSNVTYSLTSDINLSGYGTGCRSGNPQYLVAITRAKPSDWKITANASADTIGLLTGAPTDDISGRSRRTATPVGAGCWRADSPSKPQITDQPDTVIVNEDSTVTFSVVATGSGLTYGWYKTGAVTKLSDSAKYIKIAAFSDSGAEYYCVVTNGNGADTSKHAVLNILKRPAITKDIVDTSVSVGDTLRLFVKATGSRISYQWYLNGAAITGATKDSVALNGITSENDSDSVHCVVKNTLGTSVTSNKILLTVLNSTQIPKIIKEPEAPLSISVGDSLSLSTDAIGSGTISYTWYKNGLTANDSTGAGKRFYKASVLASDSGVYRCIVKNSFGQDTSTAVRVTVKAVIPAKLKNPISLECSYTTQSDSVHVTLKKIPTGAARDSIISMLIYYGSVTLGYVWDTILVDDFPSGDSMVNVYKDDKFLSDQQNITVNMFLKGINSLVSDTVSKSLQIGIERPLNTISLSIKEAHERSMDLQWTMTDESADSIRIWTGKEQMPLTYNPGTSRFIPLTLGGSTKSALVENLDTNTHYYFAAQIKKNGLWSSITTSSRADTFTLGSNSNKKVPNTIKITDTLFDSTANTLTIRWTVDSTGMGIQNPEVAICFSVVTFPLAGPAQGDSVIDVINFHTENVTTIPWNGTKLFDTTYYISMFLRNKSASWSDTAAAAQATIYVPKVKKESVKLFTADSVYAINRTILIRKGKNWSPSTIVIDNEVKLDTLQGATRGFIKVSSPFRFEKGELTSDIEIGVRYDALPGGFSGNDVYLYVYKNGKWGLKNRLAVDNNSKMVFSNFPIGNAADLKLLHILMIDTAAPRVVISDDDGPIEPNENYLSSISVADNITNVICTLKCAMINKELEIVKILPLTDTTYNGDLIINSSEFAIKSENSLRIILSVTDYHNTKRYDLSRQVKKNDNVVTYSDMTWTPVSVAAVLDEPSVEQAFRGICDGEEWKYDSLKFRIFTWYSGEDVAKDNYVQYTGDSPDIFRMLPGKVFWLKKRGGGTFNLGNGKTVSIKEPFKVTLPANQWTDFAMPYDIQLSLADIFSASNISSSDQELISFYKYDASNTAKKAIFTPIYHPALGNNDPVSEITLNQDGYTSYTILNKTGKTQVLTIPPIDKSYSSFSNATLAKKTDDGSWYIKIESSSQGDISAPVYCVFKKNGIGISKYPAPPYPGSIRVGILDSMERKTYGTIVLNDDRMGHSVPLYITNSSKSESKTVTYSLSSSKPEKSGNLAVYNAETGKLESGTGTSFSVSLEPQGHAYRWALAGDSAYFRSWMKNFTTVQFGFTKITNIAGSILGIQYTVPYSGVNAVKVRVINQLGQSVWSTTNRNLVPGEVNTSVWNTKTSGRLASGAYIIQVLSLNAVNKQVNRVQKRYMHVVR